MALATPAVAAGPGYGGGGKDLVVLTGGAEVGSGETVNDVVVFDGPVRIEGTVAGSVTAFNGDVVNSGTVREDIISFNGQATVSDGGSVGGDVTSRLAPAIAPGATVGGTVQQLNFRSIDAGFGFAAGFAFWLAISVSTLLLGLLFVLLFPRAADAVYEAGRQRLGASIGWGLVSFFAIPIVAILLFVTLVGIPLGIGLLLLMMPLYSLGYTMGGWYLGRRILSGHARAVAVLLGILILRVLALIPILGGLVGFIATILGLGMLAVAATAGGRAPREAPVAASQTP
jgi:hypothetical protein